MLQSPTTNRDHPVQKTREQQLNRACEACRLSKVRCLVNPTSGSSQCLRCSKANRTCVFAPPQKRRQRKRTDVRVAELEREVRQMRAVLKSNRISPSIPEEPMPVDEETEDPEEPMEEESPTWNQPQENPSTATTQSDKWAQAAASPTEHVRRIDPLDNPDGDIVDRGLVNMDLASELLDIYRHHQVHDCPGVTISANATAAELRAEKPILFHAVLAAAAHTKGQALSNRLHEEVMYLFARRLFISGEKSLECIQALLVTVVYYTPPNVPGRMQFYQYSNMAASMALELGLATKPVTHEQLPRRDIKTLQRVSSTEQLLENCRTLLFCYLMTAGFAMRMRRPNILHYNSWMEESLALLDKSPLLTDRRVVAALKLQRIADEAMTAFGFDDASTSFSLSELRMQVILRAFERRMEDWKRSVPREVMSLAMTIEYYQNTISMWEFGMDGGKHSAPDFRNRQLTLPSLDDAANQPETLLSHTAIQINATIKCIGCAHSLLDAFLLLPIDHLRRCSNTLFVRCIYSLVVLLRADYAIGADSEGLGTLLDSDSLKVDYYLDTIIQRSTEAIGPQRCRVPSHWVFILKTKIKHWHDEHQRRRKEEQNRDRLTPQAVVDLQANQLPNNESSDPDLQITSGRVPSAQALPQLTPKSKGNLPSEMPNFEASGTLSGWPSHGAPLANDFGQPFRGYQPALSDFSTAFQHGDLYFWNDINDTFGGWIPQGNLYSDLQYGQMNDGS